ncbi:MAG: MFS transporter [Deltaproteobacteria bacterium]
MSRHLIIVFTAMGIGVLLLAMDISAMNVALPVIEKQFDSHLSKIEWVINGYLLAFSMFIVTGGRLADIFGRKKLFYISILIFSGASLLGGLAQSDTWLICARVVQGFGAAILWPSIIGIINASVSDDRRGLAFGLILGSAGLGQSIGPITGGAFTEFLSWRWILLLNVPLGILTAAITFFSVRIKDVKTHGEKIDYEGIATLSLGLVLLMYALNQSASWGWSSLYTLGLLVLSLILIITFLSIEKRVPSALVPPDLMQNRGFMIPCFVISMISPAFFAALLYLPQYMEQFLGFSSLKAGIGMVPAMLVWAFVSPFAGKLYNVFGPKFIVSAAAVLIALGAFLFSLLTPESGYTSLLPGQVILGIGLGIGFSSITTAAIGAVNQSRSSLAGGLIYMFQIGGGALGLAVSTAIFTDISKRSLASTIGHAGITLNGAERNTVENFLSGLESKSRLVEQFSPAVGEKIVSIVHDSYILGLHDAMLFVSLISIAGAVLSLIYIEGKSRMV